LYKNFYYKAHKLAKTVNFLAFISSGLLTFTTNLRDMEYVEKILDNGQKKWKIWK